VKYVHSFSDQPPSQIKLFEVKSCDDNRSSRKNLERVGRSRHRRCDPGRAHRLLHPRLLATHRRFAKVPFDEGIRSQETDEDEMKLIFCFS